MLTNSLLVYQCAVLVTGRKWDLCGASGGSCKPAPQPARPGLASVATGGFGLDLGAGGRVAGC